MVFRRGARRSSAPTQRRRCRVSRSLTIDTVRSAINTWCRVFNQHVVFEPPPFEECSELAAFVKKFLATACPSAVEEERLAFQSIKKLLPDSCRCLENGMLDRLVAHLVRDAQKLPDGYLGFVRKEASKLFPVGWDRTYRSRCYTTNPPLSSTLENSRSKGGCLSGETSHLDFLYETLGDRQSSVSFESARLAKPMVVQSAGKPRPLSKFSDKMLVLKPLHAALYDRLSEQHWLLRGDLLPERLDRAGFRLGLGELVSGDYASATDNLSIEVAEVIVDVALRNSTRVPEGIRELAKAQLRPLFLYKGEEIVISAGQQMGSLMSFPLLCVQNFFAFRYAVKKHFGRSKVLPVLINGDDILFQVKDPLFFDAWMSVVGGVGLQVEPSKTSRDSAFGTLNSTLLRWRGEQLRQVPTLRFGMLRSSEYANSLPAGLRDFAPKGLDPQVRFNAALEYIKWHRHTILKTGLSPQEIGFRGRLAWRVCLKAGVLRTQKQVVLNEPLCRFSRELPPLPVPHNIVLSSDDIEWVPSLNQEEEVLNAREMSSRKWAQRGEFARTRLGLKVRYWMALSRPSPLLISPSSDPEFAGKECDAWLRALSRGQRFVRHFVGDEWLRRVKRNYFLPRSEKSTLRWCFKAIDRLPSYEEVSGNALASGWRPDFDIRNGSHFDVKGRYTKVAVRDPDLVLT